MRQRLIHSLIQMFNEVHNNEETPNWLYSLNHMSDNETLIQRQQSWRENYPEQYRKYGIYVMWIETAIKITHLEIAA